MRCFTICSCAWKNDPHCCADTDLAGDRQLTGVIGDNPLDDRQAKAAVAGGSGLGLSIVQRIVADHAGKLSITSEVGVGTTVRIVLPSAGADREAAHTDC